MSEEPFFFSSAEEFRAWLEKNHDKEDVLQVGYYKVATGKASMTWDESVAEALCYGWIDGVRKSIDEESYQIRFTPRREGSKWSEKNVASVKKLIKEGRMQPAGLAAFEAGGGHAMVGYSLAQQDKPVLDDALLSQFKASRAAWAFFRAQPPGYQRTVTHWVTEAKQEKTRLRRLKRVMEVSAAGKRVDLMSPFKRTQ